MSKEAVEIMKGRGGIRMCGSIGHTGHLQSSRQVLLTEASFSGLGTIGVWYVHLVLPVE